MNKHTPGQWEIREFAKTDIFTGLRYHDVLAGYGYGDMIARVFSVRNPLISDVDADEAEELLDYILLLEGNQADDRVS